MFKGCKAVAISTGGQCKRRALPGSRYCYAHVEKVPLLLGAAAGALLSLLVAEVYRSFVPSEESRRITALQQTLDPFVDLARNKYPDLDTQVALKRLRANLDEVRELAEPPRLSLHSHEVQRTPEGLLVLITFTRTKDVPLGSLEYVAGLPTTSTEKILEFRPALTSMNVRMQLSKDGKVARLSFDLSGSRGPRIKLLLSGPTAVRVQGNHNLEPFTIDVR